MTYNLPKCPHCYSQNIEPIGTRLFHCRACGKNFEQAVVELKPPPLKKGRKK